MKIEEGNCLYVLYNPITKLTKIGVSENPEARKGQHESACGCRLEFIYQSKHLLYGEKYERDVHKAFSDQRAVGEWFNLTDPKDAIPTIEDAVRSATEDPLVESYKRGYPISKIAEEYCVTRQAILARLKKYGIYDSKGIIYERHPDTTPKPVAVTQTPKVNKSQHISTIKDVDDDIMFLDGVEPKLPLTNLKRIEPNIYFNGEWYQVSLFKNGEFIYSYTKDYSKAKAYVQGVRTMAFISNTTV